MKLAKYSCQRSVLVQMVLTFWGKYLCLSRNSYAYNNLIELQKKREFVHLDSVGSIHFKTNYTYQCRLSRDGIN